MPLGHDLRHYARAKSQHACLAILWVPRNRAACRALEQLQWHQAMVQQWPTELRSTYCLVILQAISQVLKGQQQACVAPDATIKQLCQATGAAACLAECATCAVQSCAADKQVTYASCVLLTSSI